MKILLLATEDFLGAGKAAVRVFQALKKGGHDVCFLVKNKITRREPGIIAYHEIVSHITTDFVSKGLKKVKRYFISDEIKNDPEYYFFGKNEFDLHFSSRRVFKKLPFCPDIIVVTWVSDFINSKDLYQLHKLTGAKVFFYPTDMSLFTGGCHYAWECKGYISSCSNCPAILSKANKELAHKILTKKKHYINKINSGIIAPTEQLLKEISASKLFGHFPIHKVLLPIDSEIFNPSSRSTAKSHFNIDAQKKVIFFGASFSLERRKGIDIFLRVLKRLYHILQVHERKDVVILIAGNIAEQDALRKIIPFDICFTGYILGDQMLSFAYQAADVFVCTSIQDSGPMMVNEAMMCGTPVVMHNIGVAHDLVIDGFSGYKIQIGDEQAFAEGINCFVRAQPENKVEHDRIAHHAKRQTDYNQFAEKFEKCIESD